MTLSGQLLVATVWCGVQLMPHQPPAALPRPRPRTSLRLGPADTGNTAPCPLHPPTGGGRCPDYVTQMNDDGKEGVWSLVTAHCLVRGRAPRVLCLGRAKHESDNSAFLLPRLYSPAFTVHTCDRAPPRLLQIRERDEGRQQ